MSTIAVLIDDDPDDLELLKDAILAIDAAVFCISFIYPLEAIKVINEELIVSPDFLFIDINMPRMTGDQVLRALRKNETLAGTVITMLSTSMPDNVSQALKEAGANYTLQKPSKMEDYVNILSLVIG